MNLMISIFVVALLAGCAQPPEQGQQAHDAEPAS